MLPSLRWQFRASPLYMGTSNLLLLCEAFRMTQHPNTKKSHWPATLLLGALLVMSVLSACSPNAASDPLLAGRVDGSPITLASYQRILAVYTAIDAQQEVLDWQLPDGRGLLV